ncbi:hypothetical protein RN001_011218 [Aquatica leii]|uniref:Cyclic nucleotide-binding domain-containing protein n=1 Tax=Aquatica leii TaxID=1421715 RepID=A0AAN7P7L8_9COLE|nr:hypothetical protein RN001_011218 [Aquatica leii]
MYAYTYIVNLFTTTGYMDCAPLTKLEIIVSILILFVFQMSTIALISQFTSLLEIRQYSHNNYEHQIKLLDKYLNLWTLHGGVSIPEMIINAPPSLKQDLMKSLYGYHVSNHFLFKDTHVDFLRQLVVHLKRCLFFPQNYLVTKDDIDGSMYFIHQGTLLQLLDENDTFGEEQLLYNTRHKQSYKARTVVDVVILNRTEWSYLLQWFPASRAEIFKKAREYCITSQD